MVEEHPLLPTKEQSGLMDELVQGMDLDAYAAKHADHANIDKDDKDIVMERCVHESQQKGQRKLINEGQ